jgi:hypothetical protein
MIDTCHSGGLDDRHLSAIYSIDVTRVANAMSSPDQGGAFVLTAATGSQSAFEKMDPWNNGAFTKAIVEGLRFFAAKQNGDVKLERLSEWVNCRVGELTGGLQTPTYAAWGNMNTSSLVLARRLSPSPPPLDVPTSCQ